MELRLKVITLNCWGLAVISKDRRKRMLAIGDELSSGDYDFAVLQEVWCKSDYECIAHLTQDVLPHSYYFYSGVIGSGLCVFSKVEIADVQFLPFCLNGYPHMISHGDWFSGKGVGMCRVVYEGLDINIFTAHLHAEYNRKNDQYLSHRLSQAFDFSQFVKYMHNTSHLSIVAGDFNAEPEDLPCKLMRLNGRLKDAFLEQEMKSFDDVGATNCHPRNSYTPNSLKVGLDPGKRIDYIFYNHREDVGMKVLSCETSLDKCPNEPMSFSDHEAVVATFLLTKPPSAVPKPVEDLTEPLTTLKQAKSLLEANLRQLHKDKMFFFIMFALLFCLVFGSIGMDNLPYIPAWLMAVLRIVLSILMTFCLCMASIWNAMERNSILATYNAIVLIIKNTVR